MTTQIDGPERKLPFGDSGEITVIMHEASDRYYIVSREKDSFGVPLLEMQVNRAQIGGQDCREMVAVAVWGAMIRDGEQFLAIESEVAHGKASTTQADQAGA